MNCLKFQQKKMSEHPGFYLLFFKSYTEHQWRKWRKAQLIEVKNTKIKPESSWEDYMFFKHLYITNIKFNMPAIQIMIYGGINWSLTKMIKLRSFKDHASGPGPQERVLGINELVYLTLGLNTVLKYFNQSKPSHENYLEYTSIQF